MPDRDTCHAVPDFAALSGEMGSLIEHMHNGLAYCRMVFEAGRPTDFVFLYTNPAFEAQTGLTQVVGKRASEVIPGIRTADPQLFEIYGRVARGGAPASFETYVRSQNLWLSISVYSPKPEHFVALFDVITRRKHTERELAVANERLALAQRAAGAGVWDWDIAAGTITWSNELFRLFGLDPARHDASFESWRQVVHPEDRVHAEAVIMDALRDHAHLFNEYRIVRPDGETRWIDALGDTTYDDAGRATRMIGICIDVTERKANEAQIEFLAHHDPLTQLPNRFVAKERLKLAMAYADRAMGNVALLFLDLDRFKAVNDMLGHSTGDLLLVEVAHRLRSCLRETDTVSRLGGDEFLIILTDIPDLDSVAASAAKIVAALAAPCDLDGHVLAVTASVGIALYPNDAESPDTLMQQADTAMYHAKEHGGNDYSFFSEQMNAAVAHALAIRGELHQALADRELELYFQPQVSIATRRIIGAEALLRWRSPTRGLRLPEEFVPVAEDCGLIVPIGEWVLHEACRQAMRWQDAGWADLSVAVNLSALQFRRGDLRQAVVQALQTSGLAPGLLELELTESILLMEAEHAMQTIHHLRSLGVRFAIDDFGTGYSSLAYLQQFPIDKLKIGQTFVRDMNVNPGDAAIVHAIIQMARALNLQTVAEGIESEGLLDHLRLHHCDAAQGMLLSGPLAADAFLDYLRASA